MVLENKYLRSSRCRNKVIQKKIRHYKVKRKSYFLNNWAKKVTKFLLFFIGFKSDIDEKLSKNVIKIIRKYTDFNEELVNFFSYSLCINLWTTDVLRFFQWIMRKEFFEVLTRHSEVFMR